MINMIDTSVFYKLDGELLYGSNLVRYMQALLQFNSECLIGRLVNVC